MKFRCWYIPIWIAGASCLFTGVRSGLWYMIIIGLITIAVPFLLWFAVKPKIPKEYRPEIPTEPISMAGNEHPAYERVRFAVVNVDEHQSVLRKVYKIQQKGNFEDEPDCIMYPRGSYENPQFAVYLNSDRIGDADEKKCREIYDLLGQGKLSGISYEIDAEFVDDIDDLYFTCVVTLVVEMP